MRLTTRQWGRFLFFVLAFGFAGAVAGAQALIESPADEVSRINSILAHAHNAIAAVYDYRGTMVKQERFGDELVEQKLEFKFSRPFKVYVKYLEPHAGREGIFVRGRNRDRLRAHKGSAPDFAVSVNPYRPIAMEGNHHPITSFGLERMLEIATLNISKAIQRGDALLDLSDGGLVNGEPTWRIDLESRAGGRTVVARRGEDLWELATRVRQDMYVILHHNVGIDSPTDLSEGQEVFVPHYYARRGHYYIGKRSFMLLKAQSWDHRDELYERYEYTSLELNPGLEDRDFDHRNQDYGFVPSDQR
jgi:outer membrane lipoprotein-sorting protein